MDNPIILIEAGEDTPYVEVKSDGQINSVCIKGISMPENTLEFYEPLFLSVETKMNYKLPTTLTMQLDYMNSMSNKQIYKLMNNFKNKCSKLTIIWLYAQGDELIKTKGEELRIALKDVDFAVKEQD